MKELRKGCTEAGTYGESRHNLSSLKASEDTDTGEENLEEKAVPGRLAAKGLFNEAEAAAVKIQRAGKKSLI